MLLKKLFNTILILIGIVLLLAAAAFAVMMIGHVSLFGYSYISLNYTTPATDNHFDVSNLSKLDIETSNIDVRIINPDNNSSGNTGYYAFKVNMQGIVKSDVKDVSFLNNVKPSVDGNGALVIKTSAPYGLFFKNSTILEINLPKSKTIDEIKINTNSKDLTFGKNDFTVKKLIITAGQSLFNSPVTLSSKLNITEELKINANYGRVIVNSSVKNLIVESQAGSIVVNKSITGNLTINGGNPLVTVGSFPGNWRDRKDLTNNDLKSLNEVNVDGDLLINKLSDGGNIKVSGSVNNVTISQSSIVEFWANKVKGVLTCSDGSNNIRIFGSLGTSNQTGTSKIITGNGSLFVNNARCTLDIEAQRGDVYVKNAYNNVTINSTNGSSVVHYNENASSSCKTNITNERWNITVTNIKGTVNLNAKSGSVRADFLAVSGKNKIYAARYIDANIKDGAGAIFKLITSSKLNSGSVNVELPPLVYNNWDDSTQSNGWRYKTNLINTDDKNIADELLLQITGNDRIKAVLVTKFEPI